ncbi:AAA domain-containing protein [Clostridium magnum]|uniref:Serine/threonine-protein kinase PknA n=1 Tax=Clostridium magnum DSM 2767 TaxID=1121326 RepID=A0A161WR49_9CLOT|nr:AAA domain-containing protein [Clostridium magnum]KZL89178.1 serine/threonine-protein kinase PknA [Clostridium magnum DSM 2767]SHJ24595.1 Protein kinase domain-containing protein [Clostridium magnum DSM 2767]
MFENYEEVGTIYYNKITGSRIKELKDKETGECYAAKIVGPIDDSLKNTIFNRELNALKVLNKYDNIVTLHHNEMGINRKDNKRYGILLLEKINGKSLDKIQLSDIEGTDRYKISIGIIEAINNAHINSIIHRDIKPSNIMIEGTNVKVIDFGISKIKSCIDEGTVQDMKSKEYCAPEVALRSDASELSDIYSIGAVIYNLFTGQKPPQPAQFEETIDNSELREDLKEILKRMLKELPEKRESNLEKIKKELEETIKNVNINQYKYYFYIDSKVFSNAKMKMIIKNSININEFTRAVLPKDFKSSYGFIKDNGEYEFLGEEYIMKCILENNIFYIYEIYNPMEDQKIRFKKKALRIEGKLIFNSSKIENNSNRKLDVMLNNQKDIYNSKTEKDNVFFNYFKLWKNYLCDSIDHEKCKGVEFSYKEYKIENKKIILKVNDFLNRDVDDLKDDTKFIIEHIEAGKQAITRIGSFEGTEYIDGDTYIIINIDEKESKGRIKRLLDMGLNLKDDYTYKIKAYKKQITAINQLRDDNYESKNLKDIILDYTKPKLIGNLKEVKFRSKLINEYQKSSVRKFLSSESIALIQGPPGTGKTTVINEIIFQILQEGKRFMNLPKILVVSQSHTAVDNILEGLLKENLDIKIFRVGNEKNISDRIKDEFTISVLKEKFIERIKEKCSEYSKRFNEINKNDEKNMKIIEIQKEWLERINSSDDIECQIINSAVVVAGTCVGFSSNQNIKEMLFDYVIVDEAAKATTPELLVSIIKAKKILLVGDHMQLPPYVNDNGIEWVDEETLKELKTSLFTTLFKPLGLPETHKQKLGTQYRMHPNIGNLISHVFYEDTIDSGVSEAEKQHPIDELKEYSIIWYDTSGCGKKKQHKKTPGNSYYNSCEVEIIKDFIRKYSELISNEGNDIGIITGYSAQKALISKEISNYNLDNKIDVNTVDAFQGREKDIIIYSTVRSSDKNTSIGFQKEAERINVAFSRAKKLLIIVGNMNMFSVWGTDRERFPEVVLYIKENSEKCLIVDCSKEKINGRIFKEAN